MPAVADLSSRNSAKFATWLYNECVQLEVVFRFQHIVTKNRFDPTHDITSIDIEPVGVEHPEPEHMPCSNLVFAAGAFTTGAFKKVFTKTSQALENRARLYEWFRFRAPHMAYKDDVGLIIPEAAAAVADLDDRVFMVAQPESKTVRVVGLRAGPVDQDFQLEHALGNLGTGTTDLKSAVAPYISIEGFDPTDSKDKKHLMDKGRALTSTAKDGGPIMRKVPFSALGRTSSTGDDSRSCGIWLCYGFGQHGTFLAPGAAKLLVQKMCGDVVKSTS